MRTLTATDLKTRTGEFFEALLVDGGVTITRNGRSFRLRLERGAAAPKKTLGDALAMDMEGMDCYKDWDFPNVETSPLKAITFEK